VIHLYAFARNLRGLPPERGLDGVPLESRAVEGATAVVSRVEAPESGASQAALVQHGLVVEAVLERADSVVPVRFGQRFHDDADLRAAARRLRPGLGTRLGAVEGCVEVGIRVVDRSPVAPLPETGNTDGTAYMRARLETLSARDGLVRALHVPLERRAAACVVSKGGAREVVHEAAYLVRRESIGGFTAVVDRFVARHPGLTVLCTGPWAPYSFAGETTQVAL
jgi:gas vesicle protein GvpL/GvpF